VLEKERTMNGKYILIVDDDRELRMILEVYLKNSGYEVGWASDGLGCMMKSRLKRPDLVILDLGLPGGDGLTALSRMRNNTHIGYVPVLVLSARDADEWRPRALEMGANAYLQKPIDKATLLNAVTNLLGEAGSHAPDAAGEVACPHCGGSLEGLRIGFDTTSAANKNAVPHANPVR
jgi:DNA-binding response OmpR family regulator